MGSASVDMVTLSNGVSIEEREESCVLWEEEERAGFDVTRHRAGAELEPQREGHGSPNNQW